MNDELSLSKNEPIRILHMIGCLEVGGSQAMVLNLYRAIDRTKIQFDFILDHPDRIDLIYDVEALGAKIYYMPTFKGTNIIKIRRAWKKFFKEHPEYKILHSHVRSYASLYIPIAKKFGLKTIIHSHSTSNGSGIKSFIKKILQLPLRFQADYFFGCSQVAGEWLFGKKVAHSNKYFNIKNAINVNKYSYNSEIRNKYRNDLGIKNEKVYIHVGRFHSAKNHKFLLNVFAEILKRQRNSVLILVGDGELKEEIKIIILDLNIAKSVILLGNRSDVPNILQAADCFLFPSLYEGLGIVAIEAQTTGLPCICSSQVPKEVAVTDLCEFLPLTDVCEWAEKALNINRTRFDQTDKIIASGYDIRNTSKWLQQFYFGIIADCEEFIVGSSF